MSASGADNARRQLLEELSRVGATERRRPGLLQRLRRPPIPEATAGQLELLSELATRAFKRQSDQQAALERLAASVSVLNKRLRRVESGLSALLRHELHSLSQDDSSSVDLDAWRFSVLSQNEEDGYTVALLKHCGAPNRNFVELGSGRTGGNCGLLASTAGWRGLMVDANEKATPIAAVRFGLTERVHVVNAFVTPQNVDQLVQQAGLAGEIDLFSLDIDSFEYWVLQALTACRPRLMIVEYNDRFGPEARVTVPLNAEQLDRRRHYFGASLAALTALAEAKGHRLVACDASGNNAFFVREDLAPALPTRAPAEVYRENQGRQGTPSGFSFIAGLKADGFELVEV